MYVQQRDRSAYLLPQPNGAAQVAAAYNSAGDYYVAFADGDPRSLFSFTGPHAYADRTLWSRLEEKLTELRAQGVCSLRLLDAGCGPGTWLRRLVVTAHHLGFTEITARGFDIAEVQIATARQLAGDLAGLSGVALSFEIADITAPLAEADHSVDIALCLYSVISHLPSAALPRIAAEFARVTRGNFFATVRAIGSTPTIFVDRLEAARNFHLDHGTDHYDVELADGGRLSLTAHLFGAAELRDRFKAHFDIEDLCGLDIFHSRFAPDERWNPVAVQQDRQLPDRLVKLEEAYARNPAFMERATHLLLVGRPVSRD
jgi:SAM-dependent methyltransferase